MTKILSNKSNIDLDYPICRPSLDLDFTQERLDPRITFSRGSIGTRVNRNRLIETVSANQPRFDFDPVTGECKGLLIEESRSNLVTYSEDFSNVAWVKSQSSIVASSIVSPSGSTSFKLVENTVSGVGHFITQGSITKLSNAVLTLTIFAKAAERQYFGLVINSSSTGFGSRYGAEFNLGNGTASEHDSAQGTYSSGSFSIQPYPNGWYRCTITCTTSTDAQSQVRIFTFRDANQWTSAASYAGDGTSGIYVWGAQLEAGSFPTSYIPTTASTVTRSAEIAEMTGRNFSSWYNQTEGTLFVVASPSTNGAYSGFIYLLGTDFNNGIIYLRQSDYQPVFRIRSGQRDEYSKTINGAVGFGQIWRNVVALKSAISFKTNDFNSFVSGVPITGSRATAGTLPTFTGPLYLGGLNAGSNSLNGTISRLTYYPRALKPNQLQYLTQ